MALLVISRGGKYYGLIVEFTVDATVAITMRQPELSPVNTASIPSRSRDNTELGVPIGQWSHGRLI